MAKLSTYADTSLEAKQVRRLAGLKWVNALDHGAVGDGIADDTAAIQAAIDYAYANLIQTVYLPRGFYITSGPLYLDPPGNLRVALTPTTIFQFCLCLLGDEALGSDTSRGTRIYPVDNTFVALWVGSGQGMRVSGINIIPQSRLGAIGLSQYPTTGCGIAIAGGSGGSSRTLIENCLVTYYYRGITVGLNGQPELGECVTIRKCLIQFCTIGFEPLQTQNFILNFEDCNVYFCKTCIKSDLGKKVEVWGGNYSNASTNRAKFTIGTVSTLTGFTESLGGGSFTNYRFTAVVASPDTFMDAGIYDIACVKLPGFGLIPLRIESFNPSTDVITMSIWPFWKVFHYGWDDTDVITQTELQTELQATTMLWAVEWTKIFHGSGFNVCGPHIENAATVTTIIYSESGFLADNVAAFDRVYCNYPVSIEHFKDYTDANQALFYCQQAFPFIVQLAGAIVCTNWSGGGGTEPITIDSLIPAKLVFENCDTFAAPNIRFAVNSARIAGESDVLGISKGRGHGEWDVSPFQSRTINYADKWRRFSGGGMGPMLGARPAPWTTPRLTPEHVDLLIPSPTDLAVIPVMHGDAIYSVSDYDSGVQRYIFAKHGGASGAYYTYGADLTIDWSYLGAAMIVTLSDTTKMFAGLKIILHDGTADRAYVVLGVYPKLGYVTVMPAAGGDFTAGTKTVTYNGSTVKQERYNVKKYGRQCEFGTAAPTTGTWITGDIAYNTAPAASGFLGWVCVTAGTPGTWKTFGAISA